MQLSVSVLSTLQRGSTLKVCCAVHWKHDGSRTMTPDAVQQDACFEAAGQPRHLNSTLICVCDACSYWILWVPLDVFVQRHQEPHR